MATYVDEDAPEEQTSYSNVLATNSLASLFNANASTTSTTNVAASSSSSATTSHRNNNNAARRVRPVVALTSGLLNCYKQINEMYYTTQLQQQQQQQQQQQTPLSAKSTHRRKVQDSFESSPSASASHSASSSVVPVAPSDAPQACDDENGNYRVVVGEVWDNRYEVLQLLGKGSFGQVVKVLDRARNEQLAIKIIKNKRSFFNQAQIEIRLLEHMASVDAAERAFIIEYRRQFLYCNHLCLEFELLSFNLYDLLKNTGFQGVSLNLVRKFGTQLLQALAFLSSPAVNIIHCDLKPENILLRTPKRSAIKVIDFGSSCYLTQRMYTYIQSRFYRAPEVVLDRGYGCAIDMWSLGAILVELHTGEPLFPGRSEVDLMLHMVEVLDMPPDWYVESSPKHQKFFTFRQFEANGPKYRLRQMRSAQGAAFARRPLAIALAAPRRRRANESGHAGADYARFSDAVMSMLTYDPAQRTLPHQALQHPFFTAAAQTTNE